MKVSVYSQIYNTPEAYIRQCIESVLNQTFTDFEYVIIDNGCTDGTADILREYAAKDPRIDLIRFEDNQRNAPRWEREAQRRNGGEWIVSLDSDDWIEPTFLEHMLGVAEETGADIVCTGVFRDKEDGTGDVIKVNERLCVDRTEYADGFRAYFWFARFLWNKLYRAEVFKKVEIPDFETLGYTLGMDTVMVFTVLKYARSLVVDNSVLQHYRMNMQSIVHTYDPTRIDSEVFRVRFLLDFLSEYGPISIQNWQYLVTVTVIGMGTHINNLMGSSLSRKEQLAELEKMVNNPMLKQMYAYDIPEVRNERKQLTAVLLMFAQRVGEMDEAFRATISALLPHCGNAISLPIISVLVCEDELFEAVVADDPDKTIAALAALVQSGKYGNNIVLLNMMRLLSANLPYMNMLATDSFVKEYGDVYLLTWQQRYSDVLDNMTGILFDGRGKDETFLTFYVTLAAVEQQVPAYIFGKINFAYFYLDSGRKDECRAIVDELAEMGVEETEEIAALRLALSE